MKVPVVLEPRGPDVEIDPARLASSGDQIHDDDNGIGLVGLLKHSSWSLFTPWKASDQSDCSATLSRRIRLSVLIKA